MAMLRNLRNMITVGISEAHHKKILSRLTNKVRFILLIANVTAMNVCVYVFK